MRLNKQQALFYLILFAVTAVTKIICSPVLALSGFSAVFSVALFGGMITKENKFGLIMPVIILLLSDVVLQLLFVAGLFPFAGFYGGQTTIYAMIVLLTVFGLILRKPTTGRLATAVIGGPVLFFLVSNFLVWYGNGGWGYSRDFSGLMTCYTVALPFLKNSLISTMIFLPAIAYLYNRMMLKASAVKA